MSRAASRSTREALGFHPVAGLPRLRGAAFLQAAGSTNDHDLGLFEVGADAGASGAGRGTVGLYHLAWEVDTLAELARIADRLGDLGALVGASDHAHHQGALRQGPRRHRVRGVLAGARAPDHRGRAGHRAGIRPLDLAAEQARYGAETRGGVGVSVPA